MASDENVKENSCVNDPNFAVICSFFENYSSLCGIQPPSFIELQQMIEDTEETAPQLIDLHVRLLRKAKKNVTPDKWERALARFCWSYLPNDCYTLEQNGYKHLNITQRLQLLLNLIGAQFDQNVKFKTDINKLDVKALRLEPIGRDKDGRNYWAHMDRDVNIKIYKEDLDEEKWDVIATDREGIVKLIKDLLEGKDPNRKLEEIETDEPSENEEDLSDNQENEDQDFDDYDSETSHSNHADDDEEYSIKPKRDTKPTTKHPNITSRNHNKSVNAKNTPRSVPARPQNHSSAPVALDKESFAQHLQKMDSHNMLMPLLEMDKPISDGGPSPTLSVDSLKSKINQKFSSIKPVLQTDILKTTLENASKSSKPGLKLEQILKSKLAQKLSSNSNNGASDAENSNLKVANPESEPEPRKCRIEEAAEDEREIEEPVMIVTGVGNGQDCNSGVECDDSDDEIVEDTMYVYGIGTGVDCCTGNEEENAKKSSNSAVLSHKVDNILKDSAEDPTSETIAQPDEPAPPVPDIEKKKPKLWTIDAICSSDSVKDSKRDRESVSLFPNYTFNQEIKENPKPYCGTTESYSIFSLTEKKEERDAQSMIPTNFYFGSNNQDPCFLPGDVGTLSYKHNNSVYNDTQGTSVNSSLETRDLFQKTETEISARAMKPEVNDPGKVISVAVNDHRVVEQTETKQREAAEIQGDLKAPQLGNEDVQQLPESAKDTAEKSFPSVVESRDQVNGVDAARPVEETEQEKEDSDTMEVDPVQSLESADDDDVEEKDAAGNETPMELDTVPDAAKNDEPSEEPMDVVNQVANSVVESTHEKEENRIVENIPTRAAAAENDLVVSEPVECNIQPESVGNEIEPRFDIEPRSEQVSDSVPNSETAQSSSTETEFLESKPSQPADAAPEDGCPAIAEPVSAKTWENQEIKHEEPKEHEKSSDVEMGKEKPSEVEEQSGKPSVITSVRDTTESNEQVDGEEIKKKVEVKVPGRRGRPRKSEQRKPEEETTTVTGNAETKIVTRRSMNKVAEENTAAEPKKVTKKGRKKAEDAVEKKAELKNENEDETETVGQGGQESIGGDEDQNINGKNEEPANDVSILEPQKAKRGRKKGQTSTKKAEKKSVDKSAKEDDDEDSSGNSKTVVDTKKEDTPKKKRGWFTDVDLSNIQQSSTPGVRQSRRIAQMKIKEQVQTKVIEKVTPKKGTPQNQKTKSASSAKKSVKSGKKVLTYKPEEEESEEDTYYEKSGKKKKKKSKDKLKKNFDPRKAWKQSSGTSSEEEEEEEEDHYYEEDEEIVVAASDHEFSPESDIEDDEYTPVKRARTAHSKPKAENKVELDECCRSCGKADQPEWILLCDKCDEGWHAACLKPPVMSIPEGDWFCPPCQHIKLIGGLQKFLKSYDSAYKKKINEEHRRKRLEYVGVSLANMIKEQPKTKLELNQKSRRTENSSEESEDVSSEEEEPLYQLRVRRQTNLRNRLHEYDELMNSAIERESNETPVGDGTIEQKSMEVGAAPFDNQSTVNAAEFDGKPAEKVENAESKSKEKIDDEPSEEGEDDEQDENDDDDEGKGSASKPAFIGLKNARKKAPRLTNLDVSSEDDHYSDEDFKGSSVEEQEDDDDSEKSDLDSDDAYREPIRRSTRARRQRYDKDFINDDDSEEGEEEEDYNKKKTKKRGPRSSESESEEDSTWGRRKKIKNSQPVRNSFGKKRKRIRMDSDSDDNKSKKRNSRIKYGLDEDDDDYPQRRTRGKKINYVDSAASDSEEEENSSQEAGKKKGLKIVSDDEYMEEEQEGSQESSASENGDQSDGDDEKVGNVGRRGLESDESEADDETPSPAKATITTAAAITTAIITTSTTTTTTTTAATTVVAAAAAIAEKPVEPQYKNETSNVILPVPLAISTDSTKSENDQPPAISIDSSKLIESQLPPMSAMPSATPIDPAKYPEDRLTVIKEECGPVKSHPPFQQTQDANVSLQGLQSMTHSLTHNTNVTPYPAAVRHDVAHAPEVPERTGMFVEGVPRSYPSPEGVPPRPDIPYPHPPRGVYGMGMMRPGAPGQHPMPYMLQPRMPPGSVLNVPNTNNMIGNRLMVPMTPMPGRPVPMAGPIPRPMSVPLPQIPPQSADPTPMNSSVPPSDTVSPKRRPRGRGKKQLEMERLQREREALENNRNEDRPAVVPATTYAAYQQPPFSQPSSVPVSQAQAAGPPIPAASATAASASKRVKVTPPRARMSGLVQPSGAGPTLAQGIDMKMVNCPPRNAFSPRMPTPVTSAGSTDGNYLPVSVGDGGKISPAKSDSKGLQPASVVKSEPSESYHHQPPYIASQVPRGYSQAPEFGFAPRKPAPGGYPHPQTTSTAPVVVVSRTGGFTNAGPTPVSSPNLKLDSKMVITNTLPSSVPQSYPPQFTTSHGLPTVTSSVLHIKSTRSSSLTPPYSAPYYTAPPYAPPPSTSQPPPVPFSQVQHFHSSVAANRPGLQPDAFKTTQAVAEPVINSSSSNFMIPTSESGDFGYSENRPVPANETANTGQFKSTFKPSSPQYEEETKSVEETSTGEFGGLVSYFSSQREDDLDT